MKIKTFERADKTKGESYTPENGDVVVSKFAKVGETERLAVKEGKAIKIVDNFLGVTWNGKDISIKISKGQKKILDKETDLTGKKIEFKNYTHKNYGTLIGARVVKSPSA